MTLYHCPKCGRRFKARPKPPPKRCPYCHYERVVFAPRKATP